MRWRTCWRSLAIRIRSRRAHCRRIVLTPASRYREAQPLRRAHDLRPGSPAQLRHARCWKVEQVPTLGETWPGFQYAGWHAVVAPTGTPAELGEYLRAEHVRWSKLAKDIGVVAE